MSLLLSYTFLRNWGLTVVVPYQSVLNEKILFRGQYDEQYDGGKYFREAKGIGDIFFLVSRSFSFYLPVTLSAGIKLSNGSINAVDIYDKRISDNLQIGSGSIDPLLAIYVNQFAGSWVLSGGLYTKISLRENIYGYQFGNELNGLLEGNFVAADDWYGGLQLHYLFTTRDRYEYGKIARDRGGRWLFVAPRFGIHITDELDVEAQFHLPVYQNVNESQLTSDYALTLSLAYRWQHE
ncbi:MAG: hypothetical protein ACE5D8_03915 [Fidelibacterota bacterium]